MGKPKLKPVRTLEQILFKRLRYKENVKMRKARTLQVVNGGLPGTYIVESSSDPDKVHVVTQGPDGLYGEGNDCDCGNGKFNCSHVIAARLFVRPLQEIAKKRKGA